MVKNTAKSKNSSEVARLRAEHDAREKRRRFIVVAVFVVIALALIAVVWVVLAGEGKRITAIEQAASQPIEDVKETTDLTADHVESVPEPTPAQEEGTVLPPVGGPHDAILQNCGVYTEPVTTAKAVHSLEHGAVWITYQPGLDQQQVDVLTTLADGRAYTLLSPMESLGAPVVLTAWGTQLELDDAADPRVEPFLAKYIQGEQTPEPGASCTGGSSDPA